MPENSRGGWGLVKGKCHSDTPIHQKNEKNDKKGRLVFVLGAHQPWVKASSCPAPSSFCHLPPISNPPLSTFRRLQPKDAAPRAVCSRKFGNESFEINAKIKPSCDAMPRFIISPPSRSCAPPPPRDLWGPGSHSAQNFHRGRGYSPAFRGVNLDVGSSLFHHAKPGLPFQANPVVLRLAGVLGEPGRYSRQMANTTRGGSGPVRNGKRIRV